MRKFPSIEQFRHTVANVTAKATYVGQSEAGKAQFNPDLPKPTLVFKGTTKLHGTNGGIAIDLVTGTISAQSRERELTVVDDNHGFCAWVSSPPVQALCKDFEATARDLSLSKDLQSVHIFGEWCGPSINAKTGIGKLSERFVVFAVLVTDLHGTETWLDIEGYALSLKRRMPQMPSDVNFSTDFPQWTIRIDFNAPEQVLDELEKLTLEVEAACPAAKMLGGTGIGEGIVWAVQDPKFGRHVFKTKGEKHKGTKGQRLVSIAPEVLTGQDAFITAVLTDSRLEQGFELLRATYGKVTADQVGEFLKWIGTDVLKEEADTLEATGLKRTDVMGPLNRRAKAWITPRLSPV